jgi:Na+(H+)/acetate symporter ActP
MSNLKTAIEWKQIFKDILMVKSLPQMAQLILKQLKIQ